MKPRLLILAATAAALSSCTSAYKTGQTPDDVYFSPARPQDEYVQTERDDDRRYQSREEYYDDRYLRMRVHNRMQWSVLDDYYYFGDRYGYTYYNTGFYWYNPWTPQTYWNCQYNPYYKGSGVIMRPQTVFTGPRTYNLNTYNNTMLTNNNYTHTTNLSGLSPKGGTSAASNYNNNNAVYRGNTGSNNSNSGNFLRNIFNSGNSSNNSSSSSGGGRTSSSSSSSSSSSGSSSAPVRRF